MQFGRSSEKLDGQIHQLELMLEDLGEGEAVRAVRTQSDKITPTQHFARRVGQSAEAKLETEPEFYSYTKFRQNHRRCQTRASSVKIRSTS